MVRACELNSIRINILAWQTLEITPGIFIDVIKSSVKVVVFIHNNDYLQN
jgi:hypothetical protein